MGRFKEWLALQESVGADGTESNPTQIQKDASVTANKFLRSTNPNAIDTKANIVQKSVEGRSSKDLVKPLFQAAGGELKKATPDIKNDIPATAVAKTIGTQLVGNKIPLPKPQKVHMMRSQ